MIVATLNEELMDYIDNHNTEYGTCDAPGQNPGHINAEIASKWCALVLCTIQRISPMARKTSVWKLKLTLTEEKCDPPAEIYNFGSKGGQNLHYRSEPDGEN
jgi:hypothetical protein